MQVGAWAVGEACRRLRDWDRRNGHGSPFTLAVNLSARELTHPDVVTTVLNAVRRSALDPHRLTIEVTESTAMADRETGFRALRELSAAGVRIGDRRLRDGLLLARPPARDARRHPQDRPLLRGGHGRELTRLGARGGRHRDGPRTRDGGRGRGHRDQASRWPTSASSAARSGRASSSPGRCRPRSSTGSSKPTFRSSVPIISTAWRGAGAVERGGLENR